MDPDRLRDAADLVGDRWRLLVLAVLLDGPQTFGGLEAAVGGISPAVLSARLKNLEQDGLVVATPYQDRPTRYRYEVTARGAALRGVLEELAWWSGQPVTHDLCGTPVERRWWCPTCELAVEPDREQLHHL